MRFSISLFRFSLSVETLRFTDLNIDTNSFTLAYDARERFLWPNGKSRRWIVERRTAPQEAVLKVA
ncbi:hypothetical protein CO661_09110 [Sinorhizobium fredii]|uniref:Uncharacterized protein n=1 Tax=Rhizobium fredii TaxID=380 RepID=A0A2A6M1S0_RHIFR|nr:hypothetical protein [Sinorhizobium fredii]PDT48605.1 hypothetical protein CO661_09110 [Sinorhizobium fredii]